MKSQKGFTLIELLLVLAIIGIISAIAIPALLGQREAARNRATASNASNIASALQVALGLVEDQPVGSRGVTDLENCASNVNAVMGIVGARAEYVQMKNPFDQSAAYNFEAACTKPGEVGLASDTDNGQSVINITYGTKTGGNEKLDNVVPKRPESSMPL